MSDPRSMNSGGGQFGRLMRLTLKEMRETLRDRRTIITLVLMPILVYPLLGVAFEKFLITSARSQQTGEPIYIVGVESTQSARSESAKTTDRDSREADDGARVVEFYLNDGESWLRRRISAAENDGAVPRSGDWQSQFKIVESDDLEADVASRTVDIGIRLPKNVKFEFTKRPYEAENQIRFELIYARGSLVGKDALNLVERCLEMSNDEVRVRLLEQNKIPHHVVPIKTVRRSVESVSRGAGQTIGVLIPLVLILMTITGAVYPSIDLTAGERERGTLEMLIAAPVPRMGLLLAKYVTVLTVAVLTATMNLLSMTVTLFATGLGPLLFENGLTIAVVLQVFGLLVLLAMFFSAVLLAVTSFARSFKEAQAYLIPLMIVAIAPGVFSMMPNVTLDGFLIVTPLANIVLLARDLLEASVEPMTAVVVVLSTLVYALAAIMVAARIFGTDAILYGSSGTWSELFRHPRVESEACTPLVAVLALTLAFPVTFLLHHFTMQWFSGSGEIRLVASAIVTVLAFAGIPATVVALRNVRARSAFSIRPSSIATLLGAGLLGLSLWPFVYEMVLVVKDIGLVTIDETIKKLARELTLQLKEVPPALTLTALAVIPAVCEEFFFRGLVLSSLRTRLSDAKAVVMTAAIFGVFHVIIGQSLGIERLLPSFCMGLVLGFLCVRSGSLFPGIVLHALHNGFLVSLIYLEDWLKQNNLDVAGEEHLPLEWLATAAAIAAAGAALVYFGTRKSADTAKNG